MHDRLVYHVDRLKNMITSYYRLENRLDYRLKIRFANKLYDYFFKSAIKIKEIDWYIIR